MGKLAYVFPGQGSQAVGMGQAIAEAHPAAHEVFKEADQVLGYDLSGLCFNGPEDVLRLTENTQPALLTTSIALWNVFTERAPKADYVAGHSLGEYSALVATGALSFAQAVQIVRIRGKAMEAAVPAGAGAMAAVLGMNQDELAEICRRVSHEHGTVELANLNCPGQVVISGSRAGVQKASEQAKAAGARRVMLLPVSGPFHSSLMSPAAERLQTALQDIDIDTARVPVVSNVSARPIQKGKEIREALIKQVASPVRWEDSVRWMLEQGTDTFVEIGPGRVLSGLIRKIERKATVYNVSDPESLEKTLSQL